MMRGWLMAKRFASFRRLTEAFVHIERERSTNIKKVIFETFLKQADQVDRIRVLLDYSVRPFASISDKTIHKMLTERKLLSADQLTQRLRKKKQTLSDIVADMYSSSIARRDGQQARIGRLVEILGQIQAATGNHSQPVKFDKLHQLFELCRSRQQIDYIVRILQRKLRIGLTERSIQPILDKFEGKPPITHNAPMLARSLSKFEEVAKFAKDETIAAEIKYDGERTKIEYNRAAKLVRLVSRNGKDQSESFPDLYERIRLQLDSVQGLQSATFDAEIVAVERTTNRPLPIQVLIARKGKSRKRMSDNQTEKIMLFDMMEQNGKELINSSYLERISRIPHFDPTELCVSIQKRYFKLPEQLDELLQHFKQTIDAGYEGLMLKLCESPYNTSGGRKDWAKLKKGCLINDKSYRAIEVDLVLMGVEEGFGRRKNVFGSYLFGAFHEGRYLPVCKVGTGIKDAQLEDLTEEARKLIVPQKPEKYDIPPTLKVDYWLTPSIVYELSCQDLTRSPLYKIGEQSNKGGISLRFPRFVRRRTDKSQKDATTAAELIDMASQLE